MDNGVSSRQGMDCILVPEQGLAIRQPYIIEVETGCDFDCGEIIRKFQCLKKAMTKPSIHGWGNEEEPHMREKVEPKLVVVIPKDFAELIPILKMKRYLFFFGKEILSGNAKNARKSP